jgi:hypothetical protein
MAVRRAHLRSSMDVQEAVASAGFPQPGQGMTEVSHMLVNLECSPLPSSFPQALPWLLPPPKEACTQRLYLVILVKDVDSENIKTPSLV